MPNRTLLDRAAYWSCLTLALLVVVGCAKSRVNEPPHPSIVKFTSQNFESEVLDSKGIVLVDFWATWCGPCRHFAPVLNDLAEANLGRIKIGKLNVDENVRIAEKYEVESIPMLLILKDGEVVQKLVGLQSQSKVQAIIDAHQG